jgi:PE family
MSFVVAVPDAVTAVAENVAGLGSALHAANAAPTTGPLTAGSDEVSMAFASSFSSHAAEFRALSAQAAAFHSEFVQILAGAGGAYAATEAANASPCRPRALASD